MTDAPCTKHGVIDRLPSGHCRLCRNEYMRKYLKKRYAKRKRAMSLKPRKKKEK
jgi:hypothetical protein